MQALSRNTSCVSQDFRSAGGEKLTCNATELLKGIITLNNIKREATEAGGAIGAVQKSKDIIHNNNNNNGKRSSWNNAMSPIDHSPPAVTLKAIGNGNGVSNSPDGLKRRRKMSPEKDKENVNELLMKQLAFLKQQQLMFLKNLNDTAMPDSERSKAVKEINEIFEKMYDHSMSVISSLEGEKSPKHDKFTIPDYLMKSNEVTVIVEPKKNNSYQSSAAHHLQQLQQELHEQNEIRKHRKQLKPKKVVEQLSEDIDEDVQQSAKGGCDSHTNNGTSNRKRKEHAQRQQHRQRHLKTISEVRDKHMVLLLARRKYCFTCRNKSSDVNHCHSRTSMLLHNLWRHSKKQFECHHCQEKFTRIYKLKLHKILKMH